MEKLQVAIEQARQRRAGKKPAPTSKKKPTTPKTDRKRVGPRLLPDGLAERWDSLESLVLPKTKTSNELRLVAQNPGPDAAHYDILRTKLLIELRKNGWRRVAVTSPTSGCGKSTTVANLAMSISRQGDLRTVVIDLDLRRPGLIHVFGQTPKNDGSNLLGGTMSFGEVAVALNGNLAISMITQPHADPTRLLASNEISTILDEIEETYAPDVMLFDLPPLLNGDDARAFLRNVDCALMLAQAEVTTAEQVDITEREIAEQTNVLGVVLNKCRFKESRATSVDYGY